MTFGVAGGVFDVPRSISRLGIDNRPVSRWMRSREHISWLRLYCSSHFLSREKLASHAACLSTSPSPVTPACSAAEPKPDEYMQPVVFRIERIYLSAHTSRAVLTKTGPPTNAAPVCPQSQILLETAAAFEVLRGFAARSRKKHPSDPSRRVERGLEGRFLQ